MLKTALCSVIFLCFWQTIPLLAEAAGMQKPSFPNSIHLKAMIITEVEPFSYKDDKVLHASNDTKMHFPQYQGYIPDLLRLFQNAALEVDNVSLTFEFDEIAASSKDNVYEETLLTMFNDCNTTTNKMPLEACHRYQILVGDFYEKADRVGRAFPSPIITTTSASTVKNIRRQNREVNTLEEATVLQEPICMLPRQYFEKVALQRHPNLNVQHCFNHSECIQYLKDDKCCLYLDNELQLRHMTKQDPQLELTRENFGETLITLYMSKVIMIPLHRELFSSWMMYTRDDGSMENLYNKYFSLDYCPIGKAGSHCDQPCNTSHGTSDRFGKCLCTSTRWTGDDCGTEAQVNYNWLSPGLLWVCLGMVAISFLLCVVCAIWLFLQRNRAQVAMAQPYFLLLILLGCVLSTSTIIPMAQQDGSAGGQPNESDVLACMAIPWLYSAGFCITFGTLFAKIRRIYRVVSSATKMKRVIVSMQETLLIVGAVLLVDVAILTVWSIVDPLTWKRQTIYADKFGFVLESEGYCESEHWVIFTSLIGIYHFLLIAVASYMCYLARDLPPRLSSTKTVVLAMISNLQIALMAVPVLILLGSDSQASFFVRSTAIWMNDFVVVCLIFGDLLFQVQRWGKYKSDEETGGNGRSSPELIAGEIQSYVQSVQDRRSLDIGEASADSATTCRSSRARSRGPACFHCNRPITAPVLGVLAKMDASETSSINQPLVRHGSATNLESETACEAPTKVDKSVKESTQDTDDAAFLGQSDTLPS